MNFAALRWFILAGSALAPNFSCQCAAPIEGALPDASQVMQRVVQRAEDESGTPRANDYVFEKRIVNEELDDTGTPTKSTAQTFEVIPIQGIPFSRLVKIQNRDLTAEETEAQKRKELEFRQKVARRAAEPMSRRKKNWLDTRVLDRFNFKVEGRDTFQNRAVLILSFHPKTNRDPEKTITDKVLNRLAGTLWVDEADAEVAKLKVNLTEDLSLGWFGAVGSLKQFDLELQRERLPEGVWVTRKQLVVLCGRKIFSSMAHRTLEESSKFRKP